MRQAYYYDNVVPPKDWLIYAIMLWDKVWVGPHLKPLIEAYPSQRQEDKNVAFVTDLLTTTTFLDASNPTIDLSLLSEEERDRYEKMMAELNKCLDYFIEGRPFQIIIEGRRHLEIDPIPKKKLGPPKYGQMAIFSAMFTQCLTPSWVQKAFPGLDFFFYNERSFQKCHSLRTNVFVASIEAIIPKNPDSVTISQLVDFRERNQLQQRKFKIAADEIYNDILDCTTEEDLHHNVRLSEEFLREQLDMLELNYRKCKLDAAKKVMGITFTGPALLGALSAVLQIPFYAPAAIISAITLASADILFSIEKNRAEIRREPFGYLIEMKRL